MRDLFGDRRKPATALSYTTSEALTFGNGDGRDTALAYKHRKNKTGVDDEEYPNNMQPREREKKYDSDDDSPKFES
jgi:hypothetical protein